MRGLALILLLGLVISVTCEPRDEATDQSQDQPDLKAEFIEDQAGNDPELETEVAKDEEEEPENAELAGKDDNNDDEEGMLQMFRADSLKRERQRHSFTMRGLALILLLGLVISVTCEPRDEATDQSQDQPDLKAEFIEDQAGNDPELETEVAKDEEEEPENAELAGKDDNNDDEDSEVADVQGGQLKERNRIMDKLCNQLDREAQANDTMPTRMKIVFTDEMT
ncbi:predicted protein [Nematostella vectensis]|uniref:Uncharacterized protein n=1 Tax=Nematostella vectensis TaxID=45351 RepID=A7RXS7_NEMVE|nr:predicted protein [Nematostella vectensis]|eukprot:XP_001635738.1 predicted protein [Nematostella vectensis]